MKTTMIRLSSWWGKLASREQLLLGSLATLSILLLFVFGFWQPINQSAQQSKQTLDREKAVLQTVITKANQIESLRQTNGIDDGGRPPLNQVVSESTKALGISLIRIQPRDEELQVWIAPLTFNVLLDWIKALDRNYGVQVVALDIEREDTSGMVEVRRLQIR